jgi:hypothetical protein
LQQTAERLWMSEEVPHDDGDEAAHQEKHSPTRKSGQDWHRRFSSLGKRVKV